MKNRLYVAIGFLIATFITATIGYKILIGPEASYFDCFYMTVITLSTVGYGETIDLTGNIPARIFTIVLILVGMSNLIFFVLTAITSSIINGQLNRYLRRRKMKKEINNLKDHLIICGAETPDYTLFKNFIILVKTLLLLKKIEKFMKNFKISFWMLYAFMATQQKMKR